MRRVPDRVSAGRVAHSPSRRNDPPEPGGLKPPMSKSLHVLPAMTLPSAVEPVRMSCALGLGESGHWPGTRWPRSSRNTSASPLRACSSPRSLATTTPLAFEQGPVPMRLRVGRLVAVVGIFLSPHSSRRARPCCRDRRRSPGPGKSYPLRAARPGWPSCSRCW